MAERLTALASASALTLESADLALARELGARHININSAKLAAAAQLPTHAAIVDAAIAWAQKKVGKGGNRKLVAGKAVFRLEVGFARALMDVVAGDVSVDVDARHAYKRRQIIESARELADQLEESGVPKSRFLITIPATWEGIEAAAKLREKNGIRCHLSLVFGMHQLAAAADAGAAVVSPPVGRISDFYKKQRGVEGFAAADDPGVTRAAEMHDYLTAHGYESELMPTTFRGVEQALALAGCARLSLPPKLWTLVDEAEDTPSRVGGSAADKLSVDSAAFQRLHSADEVASAKLSGSIRNASFAVVSQEGQLADWIVKRQDEAAETSTLALFRIWDYDGDGFIDREEWSGTDEVFNALDRDNNGRISLEEMAIGLGAPYKPDS